ncbi:unnamed protein product [Cercopithifilaria johnstoni]|uniref:Uncharacterized protein n=2 Tax=Cercopithifilaria johnstoni TaxID=2874296 RepID=A0A8J2Q4J8_9BILA|nr:unnamed protein product [Cercopithifilaria johnstoni]
MIRYFIPRYKAKISLIPNPMVKCSVFHRIGQRRIAMKDQTQFWSLENVISQLEFWSSPEELEFWSPCSLIEHSFDYHRKMHCSE